MLRLSNFPSVIQKEVAELGLNSELALFKHNAVLSLCNQS